MKHRVEYLTIRVLIGLVRAMPSSLVSATGALVVNNRITSVRNNDVFAHLGTGIDFSVTAPGSTGKYRDNVTFDVTTPFTGGTDIGNNN